MGLGQIWPRSRTMRHNTWFSHDVAKWAGAIVEDKLQRAHTPNFSYDTTSTIWQIFVQYIGVQIGKLTRVITEFPRYP